MKVNKKFDELWLNNYTQKTQYLDSIKALYHDTFAKKKSFLEKAFESKFEISEEIILDMCNSNIRNRDKTLQKKVIEDIDERMGQTFFNYPKEHINDSIWRRFSKYVD